MGIDIYLKWKGQKAEEAAAQITGFSIVAGDRGYLREAYHGGPYATEALIPKRAWAEDAPEDGVPIPAAELRANLPAAVETAKRRARLLYKEDEAGQNLCAKAFIDFVELAERKEAETGQQCTVYCSY